MAAPETEAREALIALLQTEFGSEVTAVLDDRLHSAIAEKGSYIGVSTDRALPNSSNYYVGESEIVVQFYNRFDKQVDPAQNVSQKPVEAQAERLRNIIRTGGDPNTGRVWYFTVERIEYPNDPTGNKTRFEAYLRARGNNTALVETTG